MVPRAAGFGSAPRTLCGTWEDAKGCSANLAKAEGLKLPSPRDLHDNTMPHLVGATQLKKSSGYVRQGTYAVENFAYGLRRV